MAADSIGRSRDLDLQEIERRYALFSKAFWASITAEWKASALWRLRRKRRLAARGAHRIGERGALIATWNARQEQHMLMLFSLTIGAAITARNRFLWVRCPACRDRCRRLAEARSPSRRGDHRRGAQPMKCARSIGGGC